MRNRVIVPNPNRPLELNQANVKTVAISIKAKLLAAGLKDSIALGLTERGIVLSLLDSILFEQGQAELLPTAFPYLEKIGKVLEDIEADIRIEGHTDNLPVSGTIAGDIHDNWELSGNRALSVLRFYVQRMEFPAKKFSYAGYGEHRPLKDNRTAVGRATNRRVNLVLIPPIEDEAHRVGFARTLEEEQEFIPVEDLPTLGEPL